MKKAYRFMVVLEDGTSKGFYTKSQVNSFLEKTDTDISRATVYTLSAQGVRDDWVWRMRKARSTSNAERSFVRWTAAETCECIELRKEGMTYAQIAEQVGRSVGAVTQRIWEYTKRK